MIGLKGRHQWRRHKLFKLRAKPLQLENVMFFSWLRRSRGAEPNWTPHPKFAIRSILVRRTKVEQPVPRWSLRRFYWADRHHSLRNAHRCATSMQLHKWAALIGDRPRLPSTWLRRFLQRFPSLATAPLAGTSIA